ncbi:MAG TPA: Flp family type IVb pilin [Rhizomicrobium sp.]|nr:Flp family type IVb pilin [Rhizomicrobium sp.]
MRYFFAEVNGATAIEYGLLAALISVVILGSLGVLSNQLDALYNSIANAMP